MAESTRCRRLDQPKPRCQSVGQRTDIEAYGADPPALNSRCEKPHRCRGTDPSSRCAAGTVAVDAPTPALNRPPNESQTMTTDTVAEKHLWPLIKGIKFAMFTTQHGNGHLHSRPMTTQNQSMPDDKLWFFMSAKSGATHELAQQPQVNISYADTDQDIYVSVSGSAQVVDDKAQRQALWTKFAQAWFPGGIDDPDLALVRVTVSHAHYWNVSENKLTQLFVMAKAVFTGQKPSALGESGEVRLGSDTRA